MRGEPGRHRDRWHPRAASCLWPSRNDTRATCGDDGNNGFGLLFNWNLLADGQHLLRALRDGEEFARVSFVVATLGVEFLTGARGQFLLPAFPQAGRLTLVEWQQSAQNFLIRSASAGAGGGNPGGERGRLENPLPGSFQSGIGVVSGWVCEADRVDIEIDGTLLQAAYGTSRSDTAGTCGDDGNNGFGLLFNWNLLPDGSHTVRALRNGGEEFARAIFTVTTLGLGEFVRDLAGAYSVPNFPATGTQTRLQWQESQQNFMITGEVLPGDNPALFISQTQTVTDGQGGTADATVTNFGQAKTILLKMFGLQGGTQSQRLARRQSADGAFFACDDRLQLRQNGQVLTAESFRWLDGAGNLVCRPITAGELLNSTVTVSESVPFVFTAPF